jgi:hypothetical protein
VPVANSEPVLNQLLVAMQESRGVAARNTEELRNVTTRVEGLTVVAVDDCKTWPDTTPTPTPTTAPEQTGQSGKSICTEADAVDAAVASRGTINKDRTSRKLRHGEHHNHKDKDNDNNQHKARFPYVSVVR